MTTRSNAEPLLIDGFEDVVSRQVQIDQPFARDLKRPQAGFERPSGIQFGQEENNVRELRARMEFQHSMDKRLPWVQDDLLAPRTMNNAEQPESTIMDQAASALQQLNDPPIKPVEETIDDLDQGSKAVLTTIVMAAVVSVLLLAL